MVPEDTLNKVDAAVAGSEGGTADRIFRHQVGDGEAGAVVQARGATSSPGRVTATGAHPGRRMGGAHPSSG